MKTVTKRENKIVEDKCWCVERDDFCVQWRAESDHFYLWTNLLPSGAVVIVALSTEENCESLSIRWTGPLSKDDFEALRKWEPWEEARVNTCFCAYDLWRKVRKYST